MAVSVRYNLLLSFDVGFAAFVAGKRRILYIITLSHYNWLLLLLLLRLFLHFNFMSIHSFSQLDTYTDEHASHFRIHYNIMCSSLHFLQSHWRYAQFIIK